MKQEKVLCLDYFGKRLNLGIHSSINDEGKEYLITANGNLLNIQNDSR